MKSLRDARRPRVLNLESLEARTTPATLSTFLTTEHVDLNMTYSASTFGMQVRDSDNSASYAPDVALNYVGINAAQARPSGSAFDFIGVADGETFYRLPQSQNSELIYLGVAAYGVGGTAFNRYDASSESGGRVSGTAAWARLRLDSVSGPGHVAVWQSGDSGPTAFMSTALGGITAEDSLWVVSGGHAHYNWGFTQPGRYEVTFRISGNVNTDGNVNTLESVVTGDPITLYFSVGNVGRFEFDQPNVNVDESAGTATVTVNRVGGSDGRVSVNYATSNGSAIAGQDYTARSGTLTFDDGETSKTFTVPITNDQIEESDETINLTLSSPGPNSIASYAVGLPGGSLLGSPTAATITILANDVNTDPTISDIQDRSTPEDTPVSVGFTIGDSQSAPSELTVSATSSNAAVVANTAAALAFSGTGANRTLTIAPVSNAFGQTTITVTVTDPGGRAASDTFVLTVTPSADTPVVTGSTTLEDTMTSTGLTLQTAEGDVGIVTHFKITNIRNGSLFLVDGTTAVAAGTFLTVSQGGAGLRFLPNQHLNDATGVAFGFDAQSSTTADDGGLGGNIAPVSVSVTPVNDAPTAGSVSDVIVDEDSGDFLQLGFLAGIGPGGGSDEAGQTLTITTANDKSSLFAIAPSIGPTGTLTFRPAANASGSANVVVTITDSGGAANNGQNSIQRTFAITVNPVNDPPIANPDSAEMSEDGGTIAIAVLDNDTFAPDVGESLVVLGVTQPANGTATFSGTQVFYEPDPDFWGTDTFEYALGDGNGGTASGVVTITVHPVNDAQPVAADDSYTVAEGHALRGNVLFNDSDADRDPLSASLLVGPQHGSLSLNANGSFTYVPDGGFAGTDSFSYVVSDGQGGTATGFVSIAASPEPSGFAAVLSNGHTDVGIAYDESTDEWEPHVHDEEGAAEYEADAVLLHVRPQAATPRPAGAAFDFVGVPAGQTIWRLPASENPDLLFLGLGAEETATGVFRDDAIALQVLAVDGPGQFAVWVSTDAGPIVHVATADGLTGEDALPFLAGGHGHANWGFTATGVYRVTVRPVGTLLDGSVTAGEPVTYVFAVAPPNAAPVQSLPASVAAQPGVDFEFIGANAVQFSDADSHTGPFTVTLAASNGTISVAPAPGLSFTQGDGARDATIVMSGTAASLNQALAGLTFHPDAGFAGTATIEATTTDPGLIVGADNAQSDTDIIDVVVALPEVSIRHGSNAAENGPSGSLVLTRTGDTGRTLAVSYTTSGTAVPGSDYVPPAGTATFAVGQSTLILAIEPIDDDELNGDRTVVLTLVPSAAHTIGDASASMAIEDDEEPTTPPPSGPQPIAVGGRTSARLVLESVTLHSVVPFGSSYTGGVRVATGDVNGDGVLDLITSSGPGFAPQIHVFDGKSGASIAYFAPFELSFTGGVFVAAADFDGDGKAELIVTPDEGGGPRVAIYHVGSGGGQELRSFFGIDDPNFRGGVRVAVGDITGDGQADLLVSAGFGGGPRVALFDGATLLGSPTRLRNDFFVFEPELRNGSFPALGDANGDGRADLFFGAGPGGAPRVRGLDGAAIPTGVEIAERLQEQVEHFGTSLANFFAGDTNNRSGVRIAAVDVDGDSRIELVAGQADGRPLVSIYTLANGTRLSDQWIAFDEPGGVFVG